MQKYSHDPYFIYKSQRFKTEVTPASIKEINPY